ncbi:hypothetical protein PRIPAC_90591 [Pristionchus pacificus]|uniref:Uncharacterized protein n=1 Tax=Pristionchus pacificus TaxID=54126 RepID=A0A2A6B6R4_PRIPA|nr:hypothetical protein PRIPAC_90591 [Pristionchus pacificus]|eukprot:PDM61579.1 hypothetical protein PRIPAC_51021 [Pristionchus pacificus]
MRIFILISQSLHSPLFPSSRVVARFHLLPSFPILDRTRYRLPYPVMRFLPILLISLALLPLSTALWCHSEKIGKGKVTMRRHDEDCDKEIDFCFTSEYIGGPEKNRGCSEAGKCTSDGCTTEELEDGREKRRCCCKGNCCNGLEKRYWCPKEFSKDGYSLPKKMVPCDEFCATEEYLRTKEKVKSSERPRPGHCKSAGCFEDPEAIMKTRTCCFAASETSAPPDPHFPVPLSFVALAAAVIGARV